MESDEYDDLEHYYDDYAELYDESYADNFDPFYSYIEFDIADGLSMYMAPILLAIGIIGNVISVIVMVKLGFQTLSTCLYLAVGALTDIFLLCIRSGNDWTKHMWSEDLTERILRQSAVACQLYSFLCSFMNHLSSWTLALAFFEHVLVIARPTHAHMICRSERVKNALLVVTLLLVCINAHVFWTFGLAKPYVHSKVYYCSFTPVGKYHSEYFRKTIWPAINVVSTGILPQLVMFACLVITLVLKFYQKYKTDMLLSNHFILDSSSIQRVGVVLYVLGPLGIILSVPETAYNIYETDLQNKEEDLLGSDMSTFALRKLASTTCAIFRDLFISCKIFVYLGCWKLFREKAWSLVSCLPCRVWVRRQRSHRARGRCNCAAGHAGHLRNGPPETTATS